MVYNDIETSNIKFTWQDLTFYFSSDFYKTKFEKEYVVFLNNETIKLCVKFNCVAILDEMILLLLYKKIEKRGFRVYYKDRRIQKEYFISSKISEKSFRD